MSDKPPQEMTKEQLLAEYDLPPDDAYCNETFIPTASRGDTMTQTAQTVDAAPKAPSERDAIAHGQKPTVLVPAKPAPMMLDERGLVVPKDSADEFRLAKSLMEAGVVNSSLRNPMQVMVAMQAVRSVGLNIYTALRQVAFMNGSLCFFGDLELAMVRMSGKLQEIREFLFVQSAEGKYQERSFENSNADAEIVGAVCRVKRDGLWHEEMFTVNDAKRAKLWGKTSAAGRPGPWVHFPSRMLQMRARGLAMRNVFSDVTQGLDTVEYGHEGVER